jgi:integrase
MVTVRSGRRVRTSFLIVTPVVSWRWRATARAANTTVRPDSCRTSLLGRGQRDLVAAVQGVLGHASIAITKDVYGHLVEGDQREAAATMSDLLQLPRGDAE